jgi:transposase
MKLQQKEFCHNCQQYVIYEFDDVTERQVIICPNCGHQHYRELDAGTIVNIRMEGRYQSELRITEAPEVNYNDFNSDIVASIPLNTKTFKIIGQTEDGRPILEKTNEINNIPTEQTKRISERRWGRDPRQR